MSSSSDIFILADSRAGIASLSYISRKNSARKVHSHKVVDLPVFLTNGSKYSEHILIRENAPFCFDKQAIYPRGVSYTSSAYSLAFAFENVPSELASDHCVEIGENLFPIGGNELFGHFLLQLVPKLIIAKKAELFKSHIFIFDDRTPARFFQILRAFDLLPTRYMSMPQNMLVTSNKSIVLSSSPVQNLVSTLSRQVQCHRDFVQAIPDSLRQYLPAIPLYGLDFRLYREMSSLPIGHVDSSRLRALPSSGGKFFLTRKEQRHRKLVNIEEVTELLERMGFATIAIDSLSIPEQIAIFNEARFIVTEMGSNACNSWLMPNLQGGVEIFPNGVLGPWGLMFSSLVKGSAFFRLECERIGTSPRRFDNDPTKPPLESDSDYTVPVGDLSSAVEEMLGPGKAGLDEPSSIRLK